MADSKWVKVVCPGKKVAIRSTASKSAKEVGFIRSSEGVEIYDIEISGFYKLVDGRGYINKYSKSIIFHPLLDIPPSSTAERSEKIELEREIKKLKDMNNDQKLELEKLITKCNDLQERSQSLENNVKVTQKLYVEATKTSNEYSMKLESALEERDDAILNMESMQEQLEMLKQALDSMTSLQS